MTITEPPPDEEPEWRAVCNTCGWRSAPGSKQGARTARLDHLLIGSADHAVVVTVVDYGAEP